MLVTAGTELTTETPDTSLIEVLQNVVVAKVKIVWYDGKCDSRKDHVNRDTLYLGLDDRNVGLGDSLCSDIGIVRKGPRTIGWTYRDLGHTVHLAKHRLEEFEEVFPVNVLWDEDESIDIRARTMYTKSIRAVCENLAS